ncbi:MAG: hypothetical protein VW496_06265 [Pelagibacteraceae bacterium]
MANQELHMISGTLQNQQITARGFHWVQGANNDDIDIDNDGVMTATQGIIDLSEALSYRLGRQIPMCANFRINYIRVSLRNMDDASDNAQGAFFQGDFGYYTPQKHRIDALQAWRKYVKENEKQEVDGTGMFISNEKWYKGFRFGWTGSGEINYPSANPPALLPNGYNMIDMLSHYENSISDTNGGGIDYGNAIYDRRVGRASRLHWSADIMNVEDVDVAVENIYAPKVNDFVWTAPAGHNIVVMGGLMEFNVTHSSTDAPGAVDDDYEVVIDLGVSGWQPW